AIGMHPDVSGRCPMTAIAEPLPTAVHPLDPLTECKFRTAERAFRDSGVMAGRRVICATVLREPDHAALDAGTTERVASVTVSDRDSGDVMETTVDRRAN
ncbi:MAG TPA: hypothetical protein PJ994_03560, partial [Tepidiformaceae bacterium]|nr:hypothetical protein [Tepidiformaceae bacterium]